MYGRDYLGVVRSSFLIDPQGYIAHILENVKVDCHAKEVMEKLKELIKHKGVFNEADKDT